MDDFDDMEEIELLPPKLKETNMKRKPGKTAEMARRNPAMAGEEKQPIGDRYAHQGEARNGDIHYKTYESPSSAPQYKKGMERAGDNKVKISGGEGSLGHNECYEGGTY
jgi:hypothetical protein